MPGLGQPVTPSRRGGNAVEFALTMPVFAVLLLAAIEFGWLFYLNSAVNSAVVYGCRRGSIVDPGFQEKQQGTVTETAEREMRNELSLVGAGLFATSCEPEVEMFGELPARSLRCELSCEFDALVGMFTDDTVDLRAGTSTRMEWQR